MVQAMQDMPGCLWVGAAHRGPRERALLSWWRDRGAIEAWYEHPAHKEIVAYGYRQRELLQSRAVRTWIEFYEPAQQATIGRERSVLVVGDSASFECLARQSLRTHTGRIELAWVSPRQVSNTHSLVMRQIEWGVRSSADAGSPFSKARVLDFGDADDKAVVRGGPDEPKSE